jgi:hypothetical protein
MEYTYEVIDNDFGVQVIKRTDESDFTTFIPKDPANADYQVYLKSLENAKEL